MSEPDNADVRNDTLAEVALIGGQIPEALIPSDDLFRRQQRERLFRNYGGTQLQVTEHARHLVALVDVLERLEQRRLEVTVLRAEEKLVFTVVKLRPDV